MPAYPHTVGQYAGYPDPPLARARVAAGLTIERLAERSWVAAWRISQYCRGYYRLKPDELARLAAVLGRSVESLEASSGRA